MQVFLFCKNYFFPVSAITRHYIKILKVPPYWGFRICLNTSDRRAQFAGHGASL